MPPTKPGRRAAGPRPAVEDDGARARHAKIRSARCGDLAGRESATRAQRKQREGVEPPPSGQVRCPVPEFGQFFRLVWSVAHHGRGHANGGRLPALHPDQGVAQSSQQRTVGEHGFRASAGASGQDERVDRLGAQPQFGPGRHPGRVRPRRQPGEGVHRVARPLRGRRSGRGHDRSHLRPHPRPDGRGRARPIVSCLTQSSRFLNEPRRSAAFCLSEPSRAVERAGVWMDVPVGVAQMGVTR